MEDLAGKIYYNLCLLELQKITSVDENALLDKSSEELNDLLEDIRKRLLVKLETGHCSELLIKQLALHRGDYGEVIRGRQENFHTSEILDIIECLELDMLVGKPFNGKYLNGYMHVHHGAFASFGYSLARNIKEYWYDKKGKIKKERKEDFLNLIKKYEKPLFKVIYNEMHTYAIRNKTLRGEWLIYKIIKDEKYYLCLASHREAETRDKSDKAIFLNKVQPCFNEFPELKD